MCKGLSIDSTLSHDMIEEILVNHLRYTIGDSVEGKKHAMEVTKKDSDKGWRYSITIKFMDEEDYEEYALENFKPAKKGRVIKSQPKEDLPSYED